MAAVTSPETSPQPRVYFQTPAGTTEEPETPVRKQGRVTVKYDRKELRKRLNLEEWIIDQLTDLYDCEVNTRTITGLEAIDPPALLSNWAAPRSRRGRLIGRGARPGCPLPGRAGDKETFTRPSGVAFGLASLAPKPVLCGPHARP